MTSEAQVSSRIATGQRRNRPTDLPRWSLCFAELFCCLSRHASPFCALQVKFLDLTLPQYWLARYDWVLSMEVIEHIPAQYETIVLDNIDRAAGHGVVLSWARIGQGGFHHVNNRSPSYVNQTMYSRGFTMDLNASLMLRKQATLSWLRNNVMLFIRR